MESQAFAVGAVIFFVLVLAAMTAVFIVLAVMVVRRNRARREAIAAFVAAGGHHWIPDSPERVRYFSSPPFGAGLRRRVTDVVYGTLEKVEFETFVYTYETESRDSKGHTTRQTHSFQVTWIPLSASMPIIRLTPDNPLFRLGRKLGARDIDTESIEFNDAWKVWCKDERLGHALLTPTMIALLLGPAYRGGRFTIEGSALMTYQAGPTDLSEVPWKVNRLAHLRSHIPQFLLEEYS